jgi:hypothetical protein
LDLYDHQEAVRSATAPSLDLASDLKVMWETRRIDGGGTGVPAEHRFASTNRAINAASRVFNTINFQGMTREDVIRRIGDPRTSSNSIYNFPFAKADAGDLVYRFDSGAGGWQFNIHFDGEGKVRAVERIGTE